MQFDRVTGFEQVDSMERYYCTSQIHHMHTAEEFLKFLVIFLMCTMEIMVVLVP